MPAPALVPAPVPAAAPAPESAPFAAPVAAPVSSTPARRALVPRLVPRLVGDDARTRVLVGLEAVLVLVLFGLAGWGPLRALARWTGAQLEIDPERGVGRFRAVRAGPPPTL